MATRAWTHSCSGNAELVAYFAVPSFRTKVLELSSHASPSLSAKCSRLMSVPVWSRRRRAPSSAAPAAARDRREVHGLNWHLSGTVLPSESTSVYPMGSPRRSVGQLDGANAGLPNTGSHSSLFPSPLVSIAVYPYGHPDGPLRGENSTMHTGCWDPPTLASTLRMPIGQVPDAATGGDGGGGEGMITGGPHLWQNHPPKVTARVVRDMHALSAEAPPPRPLRKRAVSMYWKATALPALPASLRAAPSFVRRTATSLAVREAGTGHETSLPLVKTASTSSAPNAHCRPTLSLADHA